MGNVVVTNDISKYLPKDSSTIEGIRITENQFGNSSSLKLVFSGLSETEIESNILELSAIPNVSSVEYNETSSNNIDYILFTLYIPYESTSDEANGVLDTVVNSYEEGIVGGQIFTENQPIVPIYLIVLAFLILLIILFAFSSSWVEPILFLITIGVAIIINMGTNVIFSSITTTTFSIAALLQLCLSIDYSIILLNRYKQEKQKDGNNLQAMKNALVNAFPSIAGSSLTTIVGLLCLVFMTFAIGSDIGLVLAKGVFISLLTVLFILPTLILLFDKVIEKTKKPSLQIKVAGLSRFSFKARKLLPLLFILIFVASIFLRGNVQTGYVLPTTSVDEASVIFPDENIIVLLYNSEDESSINTVLQNLSSNLGIEKITCYANSIGMQLTATQLSQMTNIDANQISGLLLLANTETMNIYDFIVYIETDFSETMSSEQLQQLSQTKTLLEQNIAQLVGSEYSRMIITSTYTKDSENAQVLVDDLKQEFDSILSNHYFLLGESAMASEASGKFDSEFLVITLITIIAIFIIVAFTFKSLAIPLVLVSVIQTAIFLTMGALSIFGGNVYFLAILIVQAILMGATIDYGILFTAYFREQCSTKPTKEALKSAYEGSIHTILTSASILFFVTGLLGLISSDPTLTQILRALSIGTLSSALLIIFVLPSILILINKVILKARKKLN